MNIINDIINNMSYIIDEARHNAAKHSCFWLCKEMIEIRSEITWLLEGISVEYRFSAGSREGSHVS